MKRKLTTLEEFFKDDFKDPELRQAYLEVLDEELGDVLRYLREQRGLTQYELSERLKTNRSRVSQIEGAEGLSLSLETIARYATALGYRMRLAFEDEEGEVAARFTLNEVPVRSDVAWEGTMEASRGSQTISWESWAA